MTLIKSNSANLKSVVLLLFLCLSFSSNAQTPYTFNGKLDFSLLGAGVVTLATSQILEHNTVGLTVNEINGLSPSAVNPFDRVAINNYSTSADQARDAIMVAALIAPMPLLLDHNIRKDWFIIGVMGAETVMLTYGITSITKTTVLRTRPFVYNSNVPMKEKQSSEARFSMFSRHTSVAASITFFGAKVFADTHPDSKWKPVVWTAAAIIPAATGWASIESGNHFPTDVIVGYSVGAAIGVLIPSLHLKKNSNETGFRLESTGNGLALKLVF